MKKALIIGGSPRTIESKTNVIVDFINSQIGGSVTWKLSEKPLPTARPEWHNDPQNSGVNEVVQFHKLITESDVIFIISPTYHGSYTSILKNALDCIDKYAFQDKTVVLCGYGSSATAILPCVHLQDVVRTMNGNVYPRFIVVNSNDINMDDRSISQATTERITEVVSNIMEKQ